MPNVRPSSTDATHDTQTQSLELELTPAQIEWLQETAEDQDLSVDQILRTILTVQMYGADDTSFVSSRSGDGAPQPESATASHDASSSGTNAQAADPDTDSIVESLRSASERLDDLTDEGDDEEEEDEDSTHDLHDTLARLKAHTRSASADESETEDENPGTVLMDDTGPSMFDMVE